MVLKTFVTDDGAIEWCKQCNGLVRHIGNLGTWNALLNQTGPEADKTPIYTTKAQCQQQVADIK